MNRAIARIYRQPKFRIDSKDGNSWEKTQKTGIRQGCPLPPYLFIVVMTVMLHDIHEDLDGSLK